MIKRVSLVCALSLFAVSANAEVNKPWYMGVSYGQSNVDSGINTTTSTESLDEKDGAYKIYAGFQHNKYISGELFYTDLGSVNYSDSSNSTSIKSDSKSYGLSAVASFPLHKYFVPFAKVGIHKWDAKITGTSSSTSISISGDGMDPLYGLGINVPITESFSFRTEYEIYKFDNDSYKLLSAGLIYKF